MQLSCLMSSGLALSILFAGNAAEAKMLMLPIWKDIDGRARVSVNVESYRVRVWCQSRLRCGGNLN